MVNAHAFLWTSIFPQTHMNFNAFLFFFLTHMDFYGFYGVLLFYEICGLQLSAQQLYAEWGCISMDFYFMPNLRGFIGIYIFAKPAQNLC